MENKAEILFVDDSPRSIDILERIMKKAGVNADYASSASEALLKLRNNKDVRIVFLDVIMPEVNGFELLQKVKEKFRDRDLKFCFLTSLSSVKDVKKALRMGISDYIVKPIDFDILLHRINQLIDDSCDDSDPFYEKPVEIEFESMNLPIKLDVLCTTLTESGGVFTSPQEFVENCIINFICPKIASVAYEKTDVITCRINSVKRNSKGFFECRFSLLGLTEKSKKKLRALVICS